MIMLSKSDYNGWKNAANMDYPMPYGEWASYEIDADLIDNADAMAATFIRKLNLSIAGQSDSELAAELVNIWKKCGSPVYWAEVFK